MLVLCFLLKQKTTKTRKKIDENLEETVASVASMVVTALKILNIFTFNLRKVSQAKVFYYA
jgi:hypothetical protein